MKKAFARPVARGCKVMETAKREGRRGALSVVLCAVEHIAAAVASKVETSVGEVVDRATVQLKENVGRVFDKAQQEAEAGLAKLKAEAAELEKRRGARSQDALLLDPDTMTLPVIRQSHRQR